jgi:DNA invertase Pin-like site-specific DNA recombinase
MRKNTSRRSSQPTRCAIYARSATVKKPNEQNSITRQIAECTRFAKGKNWVIWEDCIFTDSGQSGLKVNSGLKELMRAAEANTKHFDVMLCTGVHRVARDSDLVFRIHKRLKEHGVEMWFAETGESPF